MDCFADVASINNGTDEELGVRISGNGVSGRTMPSSTVAASAMRVDWLLGSCGTEGNGGSVVWMTKKGVTESRASQVEGPGLVVAS